MAYEQQGIRNQELCKILTCCDTTPANGNVTPLVSIDLTVYSIMLTGTGLNASVMKEESTYIKLAGYVFPPIAMSPDVMLDALVQWKTY